MDILSISVHHDTITGTSAIRNIHDITTRLTRAQVSNAEAYAAMVSSFLKSDGNWTMVNASSPLEQWPRNLTNLTEVYMAVHNPSGVLLRDLSITFPAYLA